MRHGAAVIESSEIVFPDLPPGPTDPFARVKASEMSAADFAKALQAPVEAEETAAVSPAEPAVEPALAPAQGAALLESRDDLLQLLKEPGIVIRIVEHWRPELVGTTRDAKSGDKIPESARFNPDGTVTFYPKGRKSWTFQYLVPSAEAA